MNGYYITKDNPKEKIAIIQHDIIYLSHMSIIELVLPRCREISCSDNYLKELVIPQGCEKINCSYNNLTKLTLPKSCKFINCHNNNLTKLIIPKDGQFYFWCNNLHPIIINLFRSRDPIKIQLANNLQLK